MSSQVTRMVYNLQTIWLSIYLFSYVENVQLVSGSDKSTSVLKKV
jgi:hypothetical protein